MSPEEATVLMARLVVVTLEIAGPILGASLMSGLLIGVLQTATQINEPSLGFAFKVTAVLSVAYFLGPVLTDIMLEYARHSLAAVGEIGR